MTGAYRGGLADTQVTGTRPQTPRKDTAVDIRGQITKNKLKLKKSKRLFIGSYRVIDKIRDNVYKVKQVALRNTLTIHKDCLIVSDNPKVQYIELIHYTLLMTLCMRVCFMNQ